MSHDIRLTCVVRYTCQSSVLFVFGVFFTDTRGCCCCCCCFNKDGLLTFLVIFFIGINLTSCKPVMQRPCLLVWKPGLGCELARMCRTQWSTKPSSVALQSLLCISALSAPGSDTFVTVLHHTQCPKGSCCSRKTDSSFTLRFTIFSNNGSTPATSGVFPCSTVLHG